MNKQKIREDKTSKKLEYILKTTISYIDAKKISAEEIIQECKKNSTDDSFSQGVWFSFSEILNLIKQEIESEDLEWDNFS